MDLQIQEVVLYKHLPLERHGGTCSAHPINEGSNLETQQ
jgi:hypothetical protein